MAEAETRRVLFAARPPARLEVDGQVIMAGAEGVLPAALAEELAANPFLEVELLLGPDEDPEKETNE